MMVYSFQSYYLQRACWRSSSEWVITGFSTLSWTCFFKSVLDSHSSVLMHDVFANSWNPEALPISFLETNDFLNVKWNIELLNCAALKCQEKPLFLQAALQCGLIFESVKVFKEKKKFFHLFWKGRVQETPGVSEPCLGWRCFNFSLSLPRSFFM